MRPKHMWSFLLPSSTPPDESQRVVAVCEVRGIIRSAPVPISIEDESIINLTGDCTAEPQEPGEPAAWPQVSR